MCSACLLFLIVGILFLPTIGTCLLMGILAAWFDQFLSKQASAKRMSNNDMNFNNHMLSTTKTTNVKKSIESYILKFFSLRTAIRMVYAFGNGVDLVGQKYVD